MASLFHNDLKILKNQTYCKTYQHFSWCGIFSFGSSPWTWPGSWWLEGKNEKIPITWIFFCICGLNRSLTVKKSRNNYTVHCTVSPHGDEVTQRHGLNLQHTTTPEHNEAWSLHLFSIQQVFVKKKWKVVGVNWLDEDMKFMNRNMFHRYGCP